MNIFASITSLLMLLNSFYSCNGEHAKVFFPFTVPPTNGGYQAIFATDSRWAFPEGDIMISEISFNGVESDGVQLPYHAHSMHAADTSDLVYHHSILHQGSLDDMNGTWKHFTPEDTSTWAHGAIMYGTTPKKTSFEPYGIRMRSEAPIFTCMHAKNARNETVEFVAEWEIEFEYLKEEEASGYNPRSLVTAWYSMPPMSTVPQELGQKRPEHMLFDRDLPVVKNASLKGFILHHHGWLYEIRLSYKNETMIFASKEDPENPLPDSDDTVKWLVPEQGGYSIQAGTEIRVEVIAEAPVTHNVGPLGLTLYFTCDDGMDILEHMEDLLLHPRSRVPDEANLQRIHKWNDARFEPPPTYYSS